MFVLVKNILTNEYHTIYRRDIQQFLNLKSFFNTDNFNFEIIREKSKIKKILEEEFASKGRGSEYNENLPSVTKIAYSLFPLQISSDKFLIRYWNDTPLVEQQDGKDRPLKLGTYIHKILELYVCDKEARKQDKPLIEQLKILNNSKKPCKQVSKQINNKILSDIRKYMQMAYTDEEIIRKIPDLDDIKEELEFLATKCLPKFIQNELIFNDNVYSEIFLTVDDKIQGSIDSVVYRNNKFTLIDYKTTSAVDKKTNKPKFKSPSQVTGFARQLAVYNYMLKETGMTHMFDNETPEFIVYQIHLIGYNYKKFEIPKGLIEVSEKSVKKVLDWYWYIRNNNFTKEDDIEDLKQHNEYEDDECSEFLSL